METIIMVAQLLLGLSILVGVHEWGHLIAAKSFGLRVEKFYIGFPPKVFGRQWGETEYCIGAIPLGGFVKISGMIDESMDTEHLDKPAEPWEFRSKPAWQRLIIMLGGVTVNIIVGFVIYSSILYFFGRDIITNDDLVNGFSVEESFKEFGFDDGDRVLKVNGKDFDNVMDINKFLFLRNVETIEVQHTSGVTESISIPEDIGMTMFKKGVMQPFQPIRLPMIDTIIPNFPAAKAGLLIGDKVISINNKPIDYWHEFTAEVGNNKNIESEIVISRNGRLDTLKVTPTEEGQIGVSNFANELKNKSTHITYSLGESSASGTNFGVEKLTDYAKQFKYVFTKEGATQVGGFGAIANLFPGKWDWLSFWETTALISIILAFMNILPIPALDGGHVMFLLYEMVTGRKPNEKAMEYAQMAGFFLLIALVLFANGNDIYRWLFK